MLLNSQSSTSDGWAVVAPVDVVPRGTPAAFVSIVVLDVHGLVRPRWPIALIPSRGGRRGSGVRGGLGVRPSRAGGRRAIWAGSTSLHLSPTRPRSTR
eukprot:7208150-Pyramimonas_sp.AAC.1